MFSYSEELSHILHDFLKCLHLLKYTEFWGMSYHVNPRRLSYFVQKSCSPLWKNCGSECNMAFDIWVIDYLQKLLLLWHFTYKWNNSTIYYPYQMLLSVKGGAFNSYVREMGKETRIIPENWVIHANLENIVLGF